MYEKKTIIRVHAFRAYDENKISFHFVRTVKWDIVSQPPYITKKLYSQGKNRAIAIRTGPQFD